jgi:hypothetical protein
MELVVLAFATSSTPRFAGRSDSGAARRKLASESTTYSGIVEPVRREARSVAILAHRFCPAIAVAHWPRRY